MIFGKYSFPDSFSVSNLKSRSTHTQGTNVFFMTIDKLMEHYVEKDKKLEKINISINELEIDDVVENE